MAQAVAVAATDSSPAYFLSATASAIWRSLDGETWTQVGSVSGITRLWISGTYTAIAYAGTSSGYVYRSDDYGVTWVQKGTVGVEITYLVSDPANYDLLYIGAGNVLYQSPNGGGSFITVKDFTVAVQDVAFQAASHLSVALGSSPKISRTTDKGLTWKNASFSGSPPSGFDCITTGPFSPDDSLAASGTAVWRVSNSTSGLDTYEAQGSGLSGSVARMHYDLGLQAIVYAGTTAGLEKSLDDGVTWGTIYGLTAVNDFAMGGLGVPTLLAPANIWVVESDQLELFSATGVLTRTIAQSGLSALCVGSGGIAIGLIVEAGTWKIWRTDDYGVTANKYAISGPDTGGVRAVLAATDDFTTILAGFAPSSILSGGTCWLYRSTDGGQNWTQVYTDTQPFHGDFSRFPRALLCHSSTWIMGTGGGGPSVYVVIAESTNGTTWADAYTHGGGGDMAVLALARHPDQTSVYAGEALAWQYALLMKRTTTWASAKSGIQDGVWWDYWSCLALNANGVLVGRSGEGGNGYSTDEAATWTSIAGDQLTQAITDVCSDPGGGDFYAIQIDGSTYTLKKSSDGITWVAFATLAHLPSQVRTSR